MKGIITAYDLYGSTRPTFIDQQPTRLEVWDTLQSIGNQRRRLFFLGDRLLDRLEARMLRDQIDLPPGLSRLVDEYRALFLLHPKFFQFTFPAHESVLDVQSRLTIHLPDIPRKRRNVVT